MAKQFTLIDPSKMGARHAEYGQTWWSDVEGGDQPVMFNLMGEDELGLMSKIEAETVELKTSKKGTDYLRLKKVKVLGKGTTGEPEAAPVSGGLQPDLRMIYAVARDNNRLLKQLAGEEVKQAKSAFDNVVDVDPDEEIDLSQIPF